MSYVNASVASKRIVALGNDNDIQHALGLSIVNLAYMKRCEYIIMYREPWDAG